MLQNPAHPNVIIHVDIDYFYAQVEEVLNPELKDKPFGVQQGVNIVTCNYIARSFGVKKWRPLKECLEKCPELVCVKGEDLSNYKIYSKQISELVHTLIGPSERMGLDEHYIDITKQVEEELSEMNKDELKHLHMIGPVYPNEEAFNECDCGCEQKLMVGSRIAQKLREKILQDLKLTCSVGIAHNKLLAKLVGQLNKPNNQTVLAPMTASDFMKELKDLRNIHGIGGKTAIKIEELGINTIADLQSCELDKLKKSFGGDMASRLKELSMGLDSSEIVPSGKPKTVGLEDSCRPISLRRDAEEMFDELLPQLLAQIKNDERIPQALRVTVRKYDIVKKTSTRETKQCPLSPSFFRFIEDKIDFIDGAHEKIIRDIMSLFDKIVGKEKFFVNLIGLCFCKFQEQKKGPGSITSFLVKKESIETSSKSSSSNGDSFETSCKDSSSPSTSKELLSPSSSRAKKTDNKLITSFLTKKQGIVANDNPPENEDLEPTPKRIKIEHPTKLSSSFPPLNVDPEVWKELPPDVQRELLRNWIPPQNETLSSSSTLTTDSKTKETRSKGNKNTLHNHLIKK